MLQGWMTYLAMRNLLKLLAGLLFQLPFSLLHAGSLSLELLTAQYVK
jgi:hypothetical protein